MYGYSNPLSEMNVDICWLVGERQKSVKKVKCAGVLEISIEQSRTSDMKSNNLYLKFFEIIFVIICEKKVYCFFCLL